MDEKKIIPGTHSAPSLISIDSSILVLLLLTSPRARTSGSQPRP